MTRLGRKAVEPLRLESGSVCEQWWYALVRAKQRELAIKRGTFVPPSLEWDAAQYIVRNIEHGLQGGR